MPTPQEATRKVALVTGASRGIGAAIAVRLARDGITVAVNYTANEGAAQGVVDQITAQGGIAVPFRADLSQMAQARDLVAATIARFGRLDTLVNNAAIAEIGALAEIDEAVFDRHYAINVKAPLFLVQAAADALAEARGAVVNISSIATRSAGPHYHVYAATKASIDLMTLTLSRELGPRGIRVNAVAPGMTETEMLRKNVPADFRQATAARASLRRNGHPDDIAEVVAFLASDAAHWITGEILHANGGQRP
jgi:3-oxoacyl-[acyl-carrier protein] reductase